MLLQESSLDNAANQLVKCLVAGCLRFLEDFLVL